MLHLTPEQKETVQAILRHPGSFVLHGAPGTSKSTVMRRAIRCKLDSTTNSATLLQNTVLLCCAPTAFVAEKSEHNYAPAVPAAHLVPCFTVDGLLKKELVWEQLQHAAEAGQLLQCIVCIDEVGMLSTYHIEQLCCRLEKSTKRLSMVQFWMSGDFDQLQAPCAVSICSAPSFLKLLRQRQNPTLSLRLTEQLRFLGDDSMLQFAALLRSLADMRGKKGCMSNLMHTVDRAILFFNERTVRPGLPMPNVVATDVTCIRYTNKETHAINANAVDQLHKPPYNRPMYIVADKAGQNHFKCVIGQKAMVTKNTKNDKGCIVASNGSVWTIDAVTGSEHPALTDFAVGQLNTRAYLLDKELTFHLIDETGQELALAARLATKDDDGAQTKYVFDLKHCWAITAHCSQGMTLPGKVHVKAASFLEFELLYVACTRHTKWHNFYCNGICADELVELVLKTGNANIANVKQFLHRRTTATALST